MKVGVFGGSFNPPHVAHVLACTLLLSTEDLDQVLVIPAFRHAFGKPLAPFEDRLRMCDLAMGWLRGVSVSRVEQDLGGDSWTLRTVEHLSEVHPDWKLRLIIGSDILPDAPRWLGFESIVRLAPPVVLTRAGTEAGRGLLPDVSSTMVRDLIARGAWADVERLVPRSVLTYIRANSLYDDKQE